MTVNTQEQTDAPVLRSVNHRTGLLELNRPRALNSLNPEMIAIITQALRDWENDPDIDQVLLYSGHPKAFCAGGDVRHARDLLLADKGKEVDAFFGAEYELNAYIAEYPKPYISVIDGVAMGGGLGISAHGSHRVVTANAFASMPEMAIGYFTDVGMAYMSQQVMSPALAKFWGITGYRMYAADLLYTGVATGMVEDAQAYIQAVIEQGIDAADAETAGAETADAAATSTAESAPLAELAADIEAAFSHSTWPEILAACSPQLRELVDELTAQASPASIVAALALYEYSATAPDVRTALEAEARLSHVMLREPNFVEGVRAVLVDKTKDAQFTPDSVEAVDGATYARVIAGDS
ncbi:enoyl-CoA hydratase/isomerase family protein [Corynebacterium lizhenjunii]|uniref:Enoyl-CoA hydratase/isomerase family protein n=1 Tax=Corynebacterium lizhenjunii TaxID=2709394 RepID=A0A7T0KG75_9CORY|nr:3-hydroxyisobutyryl-CoA hydrolase [Corynebacterium lizhenjunii]QPK79826.1 enoyl-CoA hydratase/isomerase family protein [Corynebacterium lizhenjunii]